MKTCSTALDVTRAYVFQEMGTRRGPLFAIWRLLFWPALCVIICGFAPVAAHSQEVDDFDVPPPTGREAKQGDTARSRHLAQKTCDALNGKSFHGAAIHATQLVAATATNPEYCKVSALISPQLNFELRLPTDWNQKIHYSGGGGYDGFVPPADNVALSMGFADVSSDSGHQGSPVDASFALNDMHAATLFGYLSVPTVMASAKKIIKHRYGSAAKHAYFEGCSNGGREGLMSAQRFPTLFDGVVARAPVYNWVASNGAAHRNAQAVFAPGGAYTPGKLSLLASAVLAACDNLDGVADGIVSNLQACSYDAHSLRCAGGADTGDTCLSDAQLALTTSWTTPATFASGTYRAAGWRLSGNENEPGAWDAWVLGTPVGAPIIPSLDFLFSDTSIKNYLAKDPNVNSLAYDYDGDVAALNGFAALNDATDVNLAPFSSAGGKLILWHGGSDPAVSSKSTKEYYDGVIASAGGQVNADQFARFYIAPGVLHCAGGPGADQSNLLAALDRWVTKHKAPAELRARKVDPATGATILTRPLCRYPEYPRYKGSGDANAASSYSCVAP